MELIFLGHATALLAGSKTIIIDPFIKNNPKAAIPFDSIPKIDLILVTHDHFDHISDAIALASRDGATLVAVHEIATSPVVAEAKIEAVGMNIGGTCQKDGVSISMTNAVHSSGAGSPVGFVVSTDGKRIYHSGDTAYFSDMKLIPKLFGPLDVALLPIGGHYGMDVKQALLAASDLGARTVIPIHYNTFPAIAADPADLAKGYPGTVVLQPGERISL